MGKIIFVTATGTGVGKTLVSAAIAYQLGSLGLKFDVLKPVLSGFDPQKDDWAHCDAGYLINASGYPLNQENLQHVSPYRF